MRNKVVLIKGNIGLSRDITLGEYERIDADRVCVIAALKRPQLLPEGFIDDLNHIEMNTEALLHHWFAEEQEHFVSSEYAEIAIDRGKAQIRAVEGDALNICWFYDMIKAFHKGFGSIVIECKIVRKEGGWNYQSVIEQGLDQIGVEIDGRVRSLQDAISLLGPHPELG